MNVAFAGALVMFVDNALKSVLYILLVDEFGLGPGEAFSDGFNRRFYSFRWHGSR